MDAITQLLISKYGIPPAQAQAMAAKYFLGTDPTSSAMRGEAALMQTAHATAKMNEGAAALASYRDNQQSDPMGQMLAAKYGMAPDKAAALSRDLMSPDSQFNSGKMKGEAAGYKVDQAQQAMDVGNGVQSGLHAAYRGVLDAQRAQVLSQPQWIGQRDPDAAAKFDQNGYDAQDYALRRRAGTLDSYTQESVPTETPAVPLSAVIKQAYSQAAKRYMTVKMGGPLITDNGGDE